MDCRLSGEEEEEFMIRPHSLYEPAGSGPHPTIVALHGWGANSMDLLTLAPHLGQGRFMVICPEGEVTVPLGGAGSGYGWFLLNPNQTLEFSSKIEDIMSAISGLGQFVDQALERYPIDANRMVLLGFSQGGVMAYGLGLGNPGRFTGVVSLSSWLVPNLAKKVIKANEVRGLPILVQHGLHDPLIDVSKARESVDLLRAVQANVTYREYEMGHEITSESLADLTRWLDGTVG